MTFKGLSTIGAVVRPARLAAVRWRRGLGRKKGLPPGLEMEDILEVCDDKVDSVSYEHISGWKRLGAFRLYLKCKCRHWTLIYKNAVYGIEEIAALDGLPIEPGAPEYLIYRLMNHDLGRYLPQSYLLQCIEEKKHYRYVMEDLASRFVLSSRPEAILNVCRHLPHIYHHLTTSLPPGIDHNLLQFDESFSRELLGYAEANLRHYAKHIRLEEVGTTLVAWSDLSELYLRAMMETYDRFPLRPIHGDLNISNIHHHKTDSDKLKIVDWEWAGIGGWWFDLVSLLKMTPVVLEHEGLAEFLRVAGIPSNRNALRAYQWGKLQRGLFDASFFARQAVGGDGGYRTESKINIQNHIRSALKRTSDAATQLKQLSQETDRGTHFMNRTTERYEDLDSI